MFFGVHFLISVVFTLSHIISMVWIFLLIQRSIRHPGFAQVLKEGSTLLVVAVKFTQQSINIS